MTVTSFCLACGKNDGFMGGKYAKIRHKLLLLFLGNVVKYLGFYENKGNWNEKIYSEFVLLPDPRLYVGYVCGNYLLCK